MTTTQDTPATSETFELYRPAADLFADDGRFVWLVDLPGIGSDEVELEIVDGKLVLEATSSEFGLKYERKLLLPDEADPTQVDATLEGGQLRIEVQKREELKPRKIQITTH